MRETGYTANHNARSLVTQRANSVAFVLTEPQTELFDDPNVSTILRACTQALAEVDLPLVLVVAGSDAERQRVCRFLDGGHADGVLLISAHAGDPMMDMLVQAGIPVVACGKPLGFEAVMSYAGSDDAHRGGDGPAAPRRDRRCRTRGERAAERTDRARFDLTPARG